MLLSPRAGKFSSRARGAGEGLGGPCRGALGEEEGGEEACLACLGLRAARSGARLLGGWGRGWLRLHEPAELPAGGQVRQRCHPAFYPRSGPGTDWPAGAFRDLHRHILERSEPPAAGCVLGASPRRCLQPFRAGKLRGRHSRAGASPQTGFSHLDGLKAAGGCLYTHSGWGGWCGGWTRCPLHPSVSAIRSTPSWVTCLGPNEQLECAW